MLSVILLTTCLLVFIIAAPSPSAFTFYNLPTPLSSPCDSTEGPDGALWVSNILANTIARIDPNTDNMVRVPIPYTLPALSFDVLPGLKETNGLTALACAIRPGDDGMLYAGSGVRNQFVRINPSTRKTDVFTPKSFNTPGDLQPFNDLTAGPMGMFFSQTTASLITHLDYKTERFTNYPVPTPLAGPLGMVFFKGNLWFAEMLGQEMAKLDHATGRITEYPVPLPALAGPGVVRATFSSPDRVCFTAIIGGGNGCLHIDTGEFDVYPGTDLTAHVSVPGENTKDARFNDIIYYSTATQNYINILNITSGAIAKIVEPTTILPVPISLPFYFDIGMNYGPRNAVWFTHATANRVGRYQFA
ncbi:hypothetical protein BDZ45DRAFT_647723 [Acephala macrosclerotiorum]|nr:hypothetical protein BDZ45DRAFT_647723 [Acephala macrosclerotiorum]